MRSRTVVAIIGALCLAPLTVLGAKAKPKLESTSPVDEQQSVTARSYMARSWLPPVTPVEPTYEFNTERFPACPVQIDADGVTTCIRRGDGVVECFGRLAAKPAGKFLDIDTGRGAICGVRTDGSHHCWTDPAFASTVANPPALAAPFQQISVGIDHVCAVDIFGQVHCWEPTGTAAFARPPRHTASSKSPPRANSRALSETTARSCAGETRTRTGIGSTPRTSRSSASTRTRGRCAASR